MEALTQLVNDSLARHGVETSLDHRRLEWSKWFRYESSFSVLLVPGKPGVFALGEEVLPPAAGGRRTLGVFRIAAVEDLGLAMGMMFLPGNPLRERLEAGRCFTRYAVIEDATQRQTALAALQQWMESEAEAATAA
jgi:hypothetical protein